MSHNATLSIGGIDGLRRFDDSDFDTFGGAEPFPFGGQAPLIYEGEDRVIIAARGGIEVMFCTAEELVFAGYDGGFTLSNDSLTYRDAIAAIRFLREMGEDALAALGFVRT